jgi:hypothetical protein
VRVGPDGRRVSARWSTASRCRRAKPYVFTNFSPPTAVRADGRFVKRERFRVRYRDGLVRHRAVFRGRFVTGGARGTLRLETRIYGPRGRRLVGRCDTGTRRWQALPAAPGPR